MQKEAAGSSFRIHHFRLFPSQLTYQESIFTNVLICQCAYVLN